MKPITWVFLIISIVATALAVVFILKNKKNVARLNAANDILVTLGQPEVKGSTGATSGAVVSGSSVTNNNPASSGSLATA